MRRFRSTGAELADAVGVNPGHLSRLPDGRLRLTPTGGEVPRNVFILVFAIGWNVLTALLVIGTLSGGGSPWFVMLFVSLFVLAGLGLLVHAIRSLVRNAMIDRVLHAPELHLDRLPLQPGELFHVDFSQRVKSDCTIERIVGALVCRKWERRTHDETTDTRETELFRDEQVMAERQTVTHHHEVRGAGDYLVPLDGVPSYEESDNGVRWMLEVWTEIADRPNAERRFDLSVTAGPPREEG